MYFLYIIKVSKVKYFSKQKIGQWILKTLWLRIVLTLKKENERKMLTAEMQILDIICGNEVAILT